MDKVNIFIFISLFLQSNNTYSYSGKPTCIWYVTLKLKVPGPNPIAVLDSSGKYEPGEGGWLRLAFRPNLEVSQEFILSLQNIYLYSLKM